MIARSRHTVEPAAWQDELRNAYRDPRALLADLGLDAAVMGCTEAAARAFPFRVTRAYASRIRPGDDRDPLLRQVLPVAAELEQVPGYSNDPVDEVARLQHGGLIQKYAGRALVLVSAACAIHCRYCFRREFPYAPNVGPAALERALVQLAGERDIEEVILSGGDPLVIDDAAVGTLLARLGDMPHLKRLRIHSRLPVVLPSRITPRLLELLAASRLQAVLVVHVNHPREIDGDVVLALAACRRAGITLLNQSVLLGGVNDDSDTLAALSTTLFAAGVLPYYVNVLDRVHGAAHFEVPDALAAELESALRARLPGYLVPRFVREVPGAPAKLPLIEAAAVRAR